MRTRVTLGLVLFAFWMLLSGYFTPLLLSLGVISCVGVILIVWRMELLEDEVHPRYLGRIVFFYLPWLFMEIVKSNIAVAKIILRPKMGIRPTVFNAGTSQKTELGIVVYANSITLTPGTVTMGIEDGTLSVHALDLEFADDVLTGEMDRKVSAVEYIQKNKKETL